MKVKRIRTKGIKYSYEYEVEAEPLKDSPRRNGTFSRLEIKRGSKDMDDRYEVTIRNG